MKLNWNFQRVKRRVEGSLKKIPFVTEGWIVFYILCDKLKLWHQSSVPDNRGVSGQKSDKVNGEQTGREPHLLTPQNSSLNP